MTDGTADDGTETPREELARRLRALFDDAGMSTVRANELLNQRGVKSSQPKVSRALTGRTAPDRTFLAHLLDLVDAPAEVREPLAELADRVKAGNRRLVLSRDEGALQDRMGRYNKAAKRIFTFTPAGLPGMAQTEPYVRRVMADERGVRSRLRNQAILDEPGRRFVWVLTDGALGFPGLLPPEGMAAQLDHLAELSLRPNVRVGIIPWGAASPVLPVHGYDLFDDQAVVTGGETYGLDLDHPDDVRAYVELSDTLESLAVWVDQARALVRAAADRYRAMT